MSEGEDEPIKTMKLYHNFERVDNELKFAGFAEGSKLTPQDLYQFDHMNYLGTEAVQNSIDECKITSSFKILDVGSGLGGPARYLSSETGCHVTALELQQDCSKKADEYTERCDMTDKIKHICEDIITCDIASVGGASSFDVITSWLVFLHIPEKDALFQRCSHVCKPEGLFYIEDFFKKGADFTANELGRLSKDVFCSALSSKEEYIELLTSAGFEVVSFRDMTEIWTEFVTNRREKYLALKERVVQVHGEDCFDNQSYFYDSIKTLFSGGNLGGCRIVARKAK